MGVLSEGVLSGVYCTYQNLTAPWHGAASTGRGEMYQNSCLGAAKCIFSPTGRSVPNAGDVNKDYLFWAARSYNTHLICAVFGYKFAYLFKWANFSRFIETFALICVTNFYFAFP